MPALLIASACPAVSVFSLSIYRNLDYTSTSRVAPAVPASVDFLIQTNQLGAVADQTARAGAGLIGVPDGPQRVNLSIGAGLLLAVSAGYAMIGGPVQIPAATTLAVPDNTARVWIWLLQTGSALTYTTTTAPPAGEVCLLGSCVTAGGVVTSVDTSGVVYLRGGVGWRQTADNGAPSDTPPASVAFVAIAIVASRGISF